MKAFLSWSIHLILNCHHIPHVSIINLTFYSDKKSSLTTCVLGWMMKAKGEDNIRGDKSFIFEQNVFMSRNMRCTQSGTCPWFRISTHNFCQVVNKSCVVLIWLKGQRYRMAGNLLKRDFGETFLSGEHGQWGVCPAEDLLWHTDTHLYTSIL